MSSARHHRWLVTSAGALLAVLSWQGCRCGREPTAVWPAWSPPTLSLLTPREMRCEWARVDPVAKSRTLIATFDHPCIGGAVTWNRTATRALLSFDFTRVDGGSFGASGVPEAFVKPEVTPPAGLKPRLYLVELPGGEVKPLGLPTTGELERIGFDASDRVLALTREAAEIAADGTVTVDGSKMVIDKDREGIPIVVRAHEWTGNAWRQVESKLSDSGWDYAQGVTALAANRDLTEDTRELLSPHPVGKAVEDAALLARLAASAPKLPEGDFQWLELKARDRSIYVWEVNIEFVWATGLIMLGRGNELTPLTGLSFTAGDMVGPLIRERYLLVAKSESGTHPRLYDTVTGGLAYSSDVDRAAVFWPAPAAAPH